MAKRKWLLLLCVTQFIIIVILLATRDLDLTSDSGIESGIEKYFKIDSFLWQKNGVKRQSMMTSNPQESDERAQRGRVLSTKKLLQPISSRGPPIKYEKTRKRMRLVVEELWYFLGDQLKTLHEYLSLNSSSAAVTVPSIIDQSIEYKRTLLHDLKTLSEVDEYDTWRSKEADSLSDLVQRRLTFLQNPKDCRNARKMVCDLRKNCGFGCQVHHIVYCLMTAYSSQRTLILFSRGWKYKEDGWASVFRPVSETCHLDRFGSRTQWKGFDDMRYVVSLPYVEVFTGDHPYLPRTVPSDLIERISKIHEIPAVWWVGQFVKYLMRLQVKTYNMISDAALSMSFEHPIVGVHIRRTDKLYNEAAYHSVDEYMDQVEEYYAQLYHSRRIENKRIYLASDDITVFEEIRTNYPDYDIIGNRNLSQKTADARYCDECLNGLIVDLHFLARSDFLVCTFSSQICRLAYELMQSLHPDASARFRSLDELYYFGGGGMHRVVAILNHQATSAGQINLNFGDFVKIRGNLWNGFSEGLNLRSGESGLFPSFKVEEFVEAIEFPTDYPQVPMEMPAEKTISNR